jgi:PAS domain S-box-containing protein
VPSQLVVIIDDRITNLKILERLAVSLGDGTLAKTFTHPLAALDACRAQQPDLIVVDAAMRELVAEEFIGRLRAETGGSDTPVLVIAAYEDRALLHQALDAGAGDFLFSPVDHREFRVRAGNLLARRRDDRPATSEPEPSADPDDALRQAHERLLRVIDAIPVMICATGRDGRFVFVNRHFAAFFGMASGRLLGKRPIEASDTRFAQRLAERDARLLAGEILPTAFEEDIVDREGEPRVLLTTKSAFPGSAADEAMVVTVSLDITARKNAELDVIAAKEQAEIANRSKTEFLANMSHELRTPLNAIIGFSQVMAGEMLGPIATQKYVGYAHDIVASAEHLLGIINDILDVSKLEAGKLDLVEESIELPKTIADLLQLVEAKARAGDVRIVQRCERDVPRLRADVRKVKQILLNLVTNAIKFSHAGGEVEIVARQQEGAISVAVVDHGIGMDATEVELAVTRFGQVASAWSRRHAGTGLGLPLAMGLAELHGATLRVRSGKGAGTTVTVTFPRERSELPAGAVAAEERAARGA